MIRRPPRSTLFPSRRSSDLLQHHLLNEPILYRRDARHSRATARFRYLYPPHGTRYIGSRQQLRPNPFPVRLKMILQFRRRHPVDSRRPFVAFYRRQSQRAVLVRYDLFHQTLVHRSLSEGSRKRCLKSIAFGPPRLHRFCLRHSLSGTRSWCSRRFGSLWTVPVPSLAPFFSSSALRSSRVTGLLRYYGFC